MSIVSLLVILCVLGVIAWLINSYVPMAQPFKQIVMVVLIVIAIVVVLNAFGLLSGLQGAAVPRAG